MISASHNPAPDNGIKFFSYGGTKLPDEVEDRIESYLGKQKLAPIGDGVGRIRRFADAEDRYVVHLLGTLPHRLDGMHGRARLRPRRRGGRLARDVQRRRRRRSSSSAPTPTA